MRASAISTKMQAARGRELKSRVFALRDNAKRISRCCNSSKADGHFNKSNYLID